MHVDPTLLCQYVPLTNTFFLSLLLPLATDVSEPGNECFVVTHILFGLNKQVQNRKHVYLLQQ